MRSVPESDTLVELPEDDHDCEHMACFCMIQLSFCGIYNPAANGIEIGDSSEPGLCADCRSVWLMYGCGRCGCREGAPCGSCAKSWEECQSGNGAAC